MLLLQLYSPNTSPVETKPPYRGASSKMWISNWTLSVSRPVWTWLWQTISPALWHWTVQASLWWSARWRYSGWTSTISCWGKSKRMRVGSSFGVNGLLRYSLWSSWLTLASGQVAKYMKGGGVRYGLLSNYNQTVFLKQNYPEAVFLVLVEPTVSGLPHQQHPFNDTMVDVDAVKYSCQPQWIYMRLERRALMLRKDSAPSVPCQPGQLDSHHQIGQWGGHRSLSDNIIPFNHSFINLMRF